MPITWIDGAPPYLNATNLNSMVADTQTALAGVNPLGSASRPVTDPAAARPTGVTSVWWLTNTQPTNWAAGDVWVVTP